MKKKNVLYLIVIITVITSLGSMFNAYISLDKRDYIDNIDSISTDADSFFYLKRTMTPESIDFMLFNGHHTVAEYDCIGEIEVTLEYNISYGDFEIYLISPDGVWTRLSQGKHVINSDQGSYKIKIVGRDAIGVFNYVESKIR